MFNYYSYFLWPEMSTLSSLLSKKVSNDQELVQSEPKSSPRNQNGKLQKLQINIINREHLVNRESSSFSEVGH